MALHEDTLREQYTTLLAAFTAAFPQVAPPAPEWWMLWLDKYEFTSIRTAIQTLGRHLLKPRFTTESTGKAISAILRQEALKRAITGTPPIPGGAR